MTDRRQSIFDKIMARVKVHMTPRAGMETPCWEWTGPDSGTGRGGGYGRMSVDGATMAVHIVMWVIQNGPVPPRKQIDHECAFRRCCNPDHLRMVTHKRNQRLRDQRRCEVVDLSERRAA
jgi:hypothetical protein